MRKINLFRLLPTLAAVVLACLISACNSTQKVVYMQDLQTEVAVTLQQAEDLKLQPGDKLTIMVFSRDRELVQMFNLTSLASGNGGTISSQNSYYTVNAEGNIEMPVLGIIHAKDRTRLQLASDIQNLLISSKLVRDPLVTVEYHNLGFYTLGEIGQGYHEFRKDQLNLLEAIAECGGLTSQGRRDNVLVLRTVNGQQTPYRVDLTNVESVYSSPVFYLQQNDIIYVQPNVKKANEYGANGNIFNTYQFWLSTATSLLSIILLLTNL